MNILGMVLVLLIVGIILWNSRDIANADTTETDIAWQGFKDQDQ